MADETSDIGLLIKPDELKTLLGLDRIVSNFVPLPTAPAQGAAAQAVTSPKVAVTITLPAGISLYRIGLSVIKVGAFDPSNGLPKMVPINLGQVDVSGNVVTIPLSSDTPIGGTARIAIWTPVPNGGDSYYYNLFTTTVV